ncbi:MAG: lipid-binding SYLF domain-containing protein [Acetobacteraceae bacterium]
MFGLRNRIPGRLPAPHFVMLAAVASLALASCAGPTEESGAQRLVDRSTLTVQSIMASSSGSNVGDVLKRARAVMICPRIFTAGFIVGASGGGCVLVGRASQGSWSSPAFYTIGAGSFGLQAGVKDAEVMMMIMSQKALNAVINSQFKVGANASIAIATIGAGVGGATTAALNADIITFAQASGVFAGISLNGSIFSADSQTDAVYYGKPVDTRQIVIGMTASNAGANPLRAVLGRYGG